MPTKKSAEVVPIPAVDLRNCAADDMLVMRCGDKAWYVGANPMRPSHYPHVIRYKNGAEGTRMNNGRTWGDGEHEYDIVEVARAPSPKPKPKPKPPAREWKRHAIVSKDGKCLCVYPSRRAARSSLRYFEGTVKRVLVKELP